MASRCQTCQTRIWGQYAGARGLRGYFQNTKKRQLTTWKRDVEVCSEETLAMGEVEYTPLGMTRRECDGRVGAMGVYKGRGMGGLEGMPA